MEYSNAIKTALQLKEISNSPITILGGAHANALSKECMTESSAFDFVAAGEGESSLVKLIQSIQSGNEVDIIPGVYKRDKNGSPVGFLPANFEEDLSNLPFPTWDLFPSIDTYPLITERGCPYKCVFCSHNSGQRIRTRSVENVMEEIKWLHKKFSSRRITIEDECFGLRPERMEILLNTMIEFNKKLEFSRVRQM